MSLTNYVCRDVSSMIDSYVCGMLWNDLNKEFNKLSCFKDIRFIYYHHEIDHQDDPSQFIIRNYDEKDKTVKHDDWIEKNQDSIKSISCHQEYATPVGFLQKRRKNRGVRIKRVDVF